LKSTAGNADACVKSFCRNSSNVTCTLYFVVGLGCSAAATFTSWSSWVAAPPQAKSKVPPHYGDPETSGFKLKVNSGVNHYPIALKSR